jgi:hypothetical protein
MPCFFRQRLSSITRPAQPSNNFLLRRRTGGGFTANASLASVPTAAATPSTDADADADADAAIGDAAPLRAARLLACPQQPPQFKQRTQRARGVRNTRTHGKTEAADRFTEEVRRRTFFFDFLAAASSSDTVSCGSVAPAESPSAFGGALPCRFLDFTGLGVGSSTSSAGSAGAPLPRAADSLWNTVPSGPPLGSFDMTELRTCRMHRVRSGRACLR